MGRGVAFHGLITHNDFTRAGRIFPPAFFASAAKAIMGEAVYADSRSVCDCVYGKVARSPVRYGERERNGVEL
jgi:hypothetical protein